MRESFPRSLFSSASSADNLINRIRRNFRDALTPEKWKMSSANGAPLHLLPFDRARQSSRAQGISFLTHAAVIAALALMAMHPFKTAKTPDIGAARVLERLRFPSHFSSSTAPAPEDRKSTRLNSSHGYISYAVFCLKKKTHRLVS